MLNDSLVFDVCALFPETRQLELLSGLDVGRGCLHHELVTHNVTDGRDVVHLQLDLDDARAAWSNYTLDRLDNEELGRRRLDLERDVLLLRQDVRDFERGLVTLERKLGARL